MLQARIQDSDDAGLSLKASDNAAIFKKMSNHRRGCARGIRHAEARAVRKADVSNEGTARSAAWRLPEAGIVKGLASPLTRTPAAQLLKLLSAWRAEPAQSQPFAQRTADKPLVGEPAQSHSRSERLPACAAGTQGLWRGAHPLPYIPPAHKHKVFIIC
ncbi:hypothetical protein D7S44_07295 [Pantoea piersonii]|nr:hypothetical protein D7S44_07295 [Pantoea piersonii]